MRQTSHGVDGESRLDRFCHDLRQYVATGLLVSQVVGVEELDDLDDEAQVRLATINKLFDEIKRLINAEVGDSGPQRTKLELAEIVGDCVRIARIRPNLEIDARLAPTATAYGDPTLLRRAVSNVLDNAARATGERGRVDVRVEDCGDESVIEITDDGVGFGRAPRGTGQGLTVVAMAMRACQGRLEIVSGPTPGTTVRMVLPSTRVAS